MTSELFARIKKLARRNGKVIILGEDDDDSLVVMPLADYEELTEDFCEEECECEKDSGEDKELIRKVNEDIAKWREEQSQSQEHKNIKTQKQEEKTTPVVASPSEDVAISPENDKSGILTEEERYYLEPLE